MKKILLPEKPWLKQLKSAFDEKKITLNKSICTKLFTSDPSTLNKTLHWYKYSKGHLIDYEHDFYPESFIYLHNPPILFHAIGRVDLLKKKNKVAIIGSRNATSTGLKMARDFATYLAEEKVTIVSGMAAGIDAEAHWATISKKGYTIGVLGTDIETIYPTKNKPLYEIMFEKGLIITETPFNTCYHKGLFPKRNRLVSMLSDGILALEASKKSGVLSTVNHGLDQGKTIMSVPGNIYNPQALGTNTLIIEGAIPVLNGEHVMWHMGYKKREKRK